MGSANWGELETEIDSFEAEAASMDSLRVEERFSGVLAKLLQPDGYEVKRTSRAADGGIDVVAERASDSIMANVKRYKQLVGVQHVRSLLRALLVAGGSRGILFTTGPGFTKPAAAEASNLREGVPRLELLDFPAIRNWTARLKREANTKPSLVMEAVTQLSRQLARAVAAEPEYLAEIEWRDMERMLAAIFEQIGFSVELTPPAKDGGRDLVLECHVRGGRSTYLVEVKHWTSQGRVGGKHLRHFVDVVAREQRDGGLFLATYGYSGNAFESLTETERLLVRHGDSEKIVSLCETFVRAEPGIWLPAAELPELLFDGL